MSAPAPSHPAFSVVVPVKPPAFGKSRLVGLPDAARQELAAAFALDTIAACGAARLVGAVLVATDDAAFAREVRAAGWSAIPDAVTGDLNSSLRQAALEAARRWPDLRPVALCADLPALRPDDLDEALATVASRSDQSFFVADAAGEGTTLYTAAVEEFAPRFGPGSRAAHDELALEVRGELASLRLDVDDLDDLARALVLGVGPRTRALAARLDLLP
ncbi:2-phospho-L-lactate guanylyltransferase [Nocardioides sp. zg-DK7169]|uniref:2-phospho-L-lactate guanylyltransferase n=1 Tax=Nocardioides sp. zg-DK7169 TaxID=2736600 RepID=UPI001555EF31|nr:2-phospho-L-lactate guanylyltransferase [Nocardioides sp. zg-DK7169]NPC95590.1 2-phospho-L-lactate guanylyltransferase [Nocardioides sp. zg-DK7169]